MLGGDVVVVQTSDNQVAKAEIEQRWGYVATEDGRSLRLEVERGDEFVPELVRGISPRVETISVSRPTLDDVFIKRTGHAIREQEASGLAWMRQSGRLWGGGRR